jgi:hypothetical protein
MLSPMGAVFCRNVILCLCGSVSYTWYTCAHIHHREPRAVAHGCGFLKEGDPYRIPFNPKKHKSDLSFAESARSTTDVEPPATIALPYTYVNIHTHKT